MEKPIEKNFIDHIANALGRKETLSKTPNRMKDEVGPPVFWSEQEKLHGKGLELFKSNLEALTGRAEVVKTKEEVWSKLREWLDELKASAIICWDHKELLELTQVEKMGVAVKLWNTDSSSSDLIEFAAEADVGLTWADYAIAYTGSIVVFSGPKQGRTVSLLPPTHIAVLRKEMIVPTMGTVIRKIKELSGTEQMPSSINFITGPSRSADIEMDLSIGVHGPYRVWVIVLDSSLK
ncbi:MAG: LutC/YkgG family protein [Bacillota bacterium]